MRYKYYLLVIRIQARPVFLVSPSYISMTRVEACREMKYHVGLLLSFLRCCDFDYYVQAISLATGTVGGGAVSGAGVSCSGMEPGSASSCMVANFLRTCFSAGRRMGLLEYRDQYYSLKYRE
jgi:hypothetical protein